MNDFEWNKFTLIESGIYDEFKRNRYQNYLRKANNDDINNFPLFMNNKSVLSEEEFKACVAIHRSCSRRKTKFLKKVLLWLFYQKYHSEYIIVFGTLTFNDDILNSTTASTRRRYVHYFLSDKTLHYISNVDFGAKNNREHYHFLAITNERIKKDSWNYGFDSYTKIKNSSLKTKRNYILKLNNHSYKDTTRQARLIYDRNLDHRVVNFAISHIKEYLEFEDEFKNANKKK